MRRKAMLRLSFKSMICWLVCCEMHTRLVMPA